MARRTLHDSLLVRAVAAARRRQQWTLYSRNAAGAAGAIRPHTARGATHAHRIRAARARCPPQQYGQAHHPLPPPFLLLGSHAEGAGRRREGRAASTCRPVGQGPGGHILAHASPPSRPALTHAQIHRAQTHTFTLPLHSLRPPNPDPHTRTHAPFVALPTFPSSCFNPHPTAPFSRSDARAHTNT